MKHTELPTQSHRITYLSGHSNYTLIHFIDTGPQLYAQTLSYCLALLPGFIRIHKSWAVNPLYIIQVRAHKTPKMEVCIGEKWLRVSKHRKTAVIKQLQLFHHPALLPDLPATYNG